MHSEFVIAIQDLRFMSIICGVCATEVTIDLDSERKLVPSRCVGCNAEFNPEAFVAQLHHIRRAYQALSASALPDGPGAQSAHKVVFRKRTE